MRPVQNLNGYKVQIQPITVNSFSTRDSSLDKMKLPVICCCVVLRILSLSITAVETVNGGVLLPEIKVILPSGNGYTKITIETLN